MSSSDSEEEVLLLFALTQSRKRKWVHEINKKREQFGEFHKLCRELNSFEDRFFIYFRMSKEQFENLHTLVEPRISKLTTNWRKSIGTKERLAICLRYMATGDSHNTIAFSYRVGRSTVSCIIRQVCIEIWSVLQPLYLATPTEEVWKKSEIGFRQQWKFPNCIGSIDGKHVRIKSPNQNIGSYGRHSDSSIFENSSFYRNYVDGKTILPPKPLPGTTTPIPHVFVGDEGFKLQTYLMRPFPRIAMGENVEKRNYNKRLSKARRVVENAFGILVQKWRLFLRPIEGDVDNVVHVVKAACCLHNYIKATSNTNCVTTSEEIETIGRNTTTTAFSASIPGRERSSNAAQVVRNHFVNYFNSMREVCVTYTRKFYYLLLTSRETKF